MMRSRPIGREIRHIICITESWANNDITDAELGLEGYVMFRKDRMGRRGGGMLLYIKETIPAYEVQLQVEADCNEAMWCKLVTGHTTVTIGVVYRCPNITKENNDHAISEVSKGDCVIPVLDNFLTQHILEPTRAERVLHNSAVLTETISRQRRNKRTIGQQRS